MATALGFGLLAGLGVGAGVPGCGVAASVGCALAGGWTDSGALDGVLEEASDAAGEPLCTGTEMTVDAIGAIVVQPPTSDKPANTVRI